MGFLYLISVWTHILAATIWIGGLFFLVLVVVPWLRSGAKGVSDPGAFLQSTGERFRGVGWVCFALLFVTGLFNLQVRGVRWHHLADPAWWSSSFGAAVGLKLGLFALVVTVSLVHDFSVGPRATRAIREDPTSDQSAALRRRAGLLGRLNGLLALLLIAMGVILVRGWPL